MIIKLYALKSGKTLCFNNFFSLEIKTEDLVSLKSISEKVRILQKVKEKG